MNLLEELKISTMFKTIYAKTNFAEPAPKLEAQTMEKTNFQLTFALLMPTLAGSYVRSRV